MTEETPNSELPDNEQPDNALPPITLNELPDGLQAACRKAGWKTLMPVQQRSIPYVRAKRDLMVQSRTGSGKTGAFILPALERIDPNEASCQALVLAPTRELARQVEAEARQLSMGSGIRTIAVYGGVSYGAQRRAFQEGAHLVVGTPGRILDHLLNGALLLDRIRLFILDEADRMLSVGFYPDMKAIQRYLPKDRHVNTVMFSATFPPHVMRLAGEFLVEPAVLSLSSDHVHVTEVEHVVYRVKGIEKDRILARLIEKENPHGAIIFCNTKIRVNQVATVLQRYGYNADQLSGDMKQTSRERVLKRIREGTLRLLVATDVAARGIDIADLSHVVQYEVPENPEVYIHRAGRTGRAGASGTAIALVDLIEMVRFGRIVRQYEIDMHEPELPTDDEVQAVVDQRVRVQLKGRLRGLSEDGVSQLENYDTMVEMMLTDGGGIRALAMLIDDFYQTTLDKVGNVSAETETVALAKKPVDGTAMANIAQSLAEQLADHDTFRLERIQRSEALVEELSMSGPDFYLLTLLVAEYHASLLKSPKKKPKSSSNKSKNSRSRKRQSNKRDSKKRDDKKPQDRKRSRGKKQDKKKGKKD